DMPLSAWQADSSVNSHLLMAQRKRIEISETEREARRGARFPRIDAFAGYSHARGESVSTAGQTTKQATAGLALTMPLYQGGRLSEVEAQSVLLAQREESELENLRSQLATEIARGHQRVSSIPERMNQLRSAQESAELGLKAAVAGHQAGTLPIWVVLDAERRLYLMRREVSKSIRESMIALVNLYVASGRFDPSRITWMESFVAGNTRQ
ncbi:MAG: TolC family protein, partial [Burkholderiales bacterium]